MELFWIEMKDGELTNLETGEAVRLFGDPEDVTATLTRMRPDARYEGKVMLVTGKAQGDAIYHATVKGVLGPP